MFNGFTGNPGFCQIGCRVDRLAQKVCPTEFRRLCDMLRMHLGNLQKYGSLSPAPDRAADSKSTNGKVRIVLLSELSLVSTTHFLIKGAWLGRVDCRVNRTASSNSLF